MITIWKKNRQIRSLNYPRKVVGWLPDFAKIHVHARFPRFVDLSGNL
jgi:hypothetical protein